MGPFLTIEVSLSLHASHQFDGAQLKHRDLTTKTAKTKPWLIPVEFEFKKYNQTLTTDLQIQI